MLGTSARQRSLKTEEIWERKHTLGQGAFGTVWLEECITGAGSAGAGRDPKAALRAVKVVRKTPDVSVSELYRELEALAKFSHDRFVHCFVRSLGWFENDTDLFIAMEYLRYGDLQNYLGQPFPEVEARQIALQVTEGLQLMHENGFAHRDLKPGNILVFRKGPSWWVKIGDFGISKRTGGSTALRTMAIGTLGYMAPEILGIYCPEEAESLDDGESIYTSAVDIWALGQLTHKMLTNEAVFDGTRQLIIYVTRGKEFPVRDLEHISASSQSTDFIHQAMAASPRKRLTAAAALKHPWLAGHEFMDETGSGSSEEGFVYQDLGSFCGGLLTTPATHSFTKKIETQQTRWHLDGGRRYLGQEL